MRKAIVIFMSGIAMLFIVALPGCTARSEDAANPVTEDASSNDGFFGLFDDEETYQIPAGTTLTFELDETVSTETNESGDRFAARLTEPVIVDGRTLMPAGAQATGRITEATESGRVEGRAAIRLVMSTITHDGETYPISTNAFYAVAKATKSEDAAKIGAGAGIGAVIGGVLGGGKGAATGAAIGGGSGTAIVLSTKGDDIELPAGRRISFVLSEPLEVAG